MRAGEQPSKSFSIRIFSEPVVLRSQSKAWMGMLLAHQSSIRRVPMLSTKSGGPRVPGGDLEAPQDRCSPWALAARSIELSVFPYHT